MTKRVPAMTTAAFFDLDGTLLPEPTLERRLMRFLYWRGEWKPWSFARCIARYLKVRVLPSRIAREERVVRATHGNKTYWKNVSVAAAMEFRERAPRIDFFAEAISRMQWHAAQKHKIFLVSAAIQMLARVAADELLEELRSSASPDDVLPDAIYVCATELAENRGRWTGEISGEAIWGMGKARAMDRLALEHGLDLAHSFAYANSASDCGMIAKVGRPAAVNPEPELRRVAKARGWPVVLWKQAQKIQNKRKPRPGISSRSLDRMAARDSAQESLTGRQV